MPVSPPVVASATTPGRRVDGAWLMIGITLLAVNLRPAVVAVAPLTSRIRSATGLSAAGVSLLTTLPLICFGIFALLAPRLGRALGLERALAVAILALIGGIALRLVPGDGALFAGSALAGAGIAVQNVLLSGLIKRDFPDRTGMMMGLYSVMLAGGATAAAGLTVPLGHALGAGWRPTLALWGILAAAGAIVWLPIARRRGDAHARADGPSSVPALTVWRSPRAWTVATYMGAQALTFYSLNAWLPTFLGDHGVPAGTAGAMLAVFNFTGIASALSVPIIATHRTNQSAVAAMVGTCFAIGISGLLLDPHGGAWVWMVWLGIAQGAGISLGLTLFVLRTRSAPAAAELSGMAQTVGYLIASLGPISIGALHSATGSWTAPLLELLAVSGVILVAGWSAGADRAAV